MPRITSVTSQSLAGLGLNKNIWKLAFTLENQNAYSTAVGDNFGNSIAASSDYIVVGAPNEDDAGGSQSGKVYVYNTSGTLLHTLSNPNPIGTSANDQFGISVAINGSLVFVGAPFDDPGGTDNGYVYAFSAITGTLVFGAAAPNASSTPSDADRGDQFSHAIASAGDYLAVGARFEQQSTGDLIGTVYVYRISTQSLLYTFSNPFSHVNVTLYGESVAIDGNLLTVGAPYVDVPPGYDNGAVYIYNLTTGLLVNSSIVGSSSAKSIGSVAMANSLLVVGNYSVEGNVGVYTASTGALLQTFTNPNTLNSSLDDMFGHSVSVSGNSVAIGAAGEDNFTNQNTGRVYLFNTISGALTHTILNPNFTAGDYFGYSVVILGNRLYIGAPNATNNSGRVFVFELT